MGKWATQHTVFHPHVTAVNHLQDPAAATASHERGPSNAPCVAGAVSLVAALGDAVVVFPGNYTSAAPCFEAWKDSVSNVLISGTYN